MFMGDQVSNPSGPKPPRGDLGPALLELPNLYKKPEIWTLKEEKKNLNL